MNWSEIREKAWKAVGQALNSQDPALDVDILGFCFLLPYSIYWLNTRQHIDTQWAACFGTLWGAIGLTKFSKRFGGGA
jgi:hypothetical protein